jgi:NAD(P)-dependent dehydrogenase (short-subunit alcohol dehydrogenase family)
MKKQKTLLISGGSKGLGRALGAAAAAKGHRVVLVARGAAALDASVQTIRDAGGEAHGLVADVGDPRAATRIAASASALVGDIDVLVHAASVLGPVPLAPLADTDDEDFEHAFAVNLLGPFRLTRALVGGMSLRGGVVVNVTSDASVAAYAGWGAYGSAKAALDQLTRIWAEELRGSDVRVFAFDPGEMDTELHATAVPDADRSTLARPDDVARTLIALIEDASRAPSGTRITLEGSVA